MNPATHGWRALRRDLHAREPRILAAALAVAVAALSAVGFFVDRVERGMEQRATALLAADLVLESSREIPSAFRDAATGHDLATTSTVSFPTVIVGDDRTELVSAKAVGDGYPLRGEARIAPEPTDTGRATTEPPDTGTVWLDPRLFTQLDVRVGERLPLGATELEIAAALTYEPDRAGELFQLAPRLMLHLDDLAASELISNDSRVTHALLVAGEAERVAAFRTWVEEQDATDIEVSGVTDARPEVRTTLDRATAFLGLAAMMTVLLAGAAVAIAVHAFSAREADVSALMRCFGARQRTVVSGLLLRLFAFGLGACLVGVALGWLGQAGLVALVGDWFGAGLPPAGPAPALAGIIAGLVTLIGFGLVPALRIRRVSVLRVLRRDQSVPEPSAILAGLLAVATVGGLLLYQAGDPRLGGYVLGGTLGLLGLLAVAAWLLVRVVGRLRGHGLSPWRFGLASIARRARTSTVQIVGFGLGLLALLLLAIVRVDLLDAWEGQIPADAPDQFMVNIQRDEVEPLRARLEAAGAETGRFYPLVRGRLVRINEREVHPDDYTQDRARRLVDREFNLSWVADVPDGNEITGGSWWAEEEASAQWSVEEDVAERLGIELDDELTFRIGGESATGRVTSLRRVNWENFQPNFFVLSTPALLNDHGAEWMTAYRTPPEGRGEIADIARDFPGVTVLDVAALIEQIRGIIDQGTRAVEYVFLFTLVAGLTVLVAAVNASREERRTEIALLRTLGASRARIRRHLIAEFGSLGALAGGIAAGGAAVTGWAISTRVLELPYAFNPWLPVLGIGGGALVIAAAGLITTRNLVEERPIAVLRAA